jgi:ATP-binding cassette subfamily B protein
MPISFFSRTQTGALISRLNNDIIGAQQAFTDLLSNVVGNVILVVLVLVTMALLSWQITLVALILVPLFVVPAKALSPRLARLFRQGMGLNAEMNTMMQERFNVSGAMLVKLFGRPTEEHAAFDDRAAGVRDIGIKQATYQRMYFVGLSLTAALATAFAYGFGGVSVVDGTMAIGTVVVMTIYLARLFAPLTQLSNLHVDLMSAVVSFERLFEVLDLAPMLTEAPDAVDIPSGPANVEFRDVHFSYPSAEEVSIASLEATPRSSTASRSRPHPGR